MKQLMKILLLAVLLCFLVCVYAEAEWPKEIEEFQAETIMCQEKSNWVFMAAVFRDEEFAPAETQEGLIEVVGSDSIELTKSVENVLKNFSLSAYELASRYMETCVRARREEH